MIKTITLTALLATLLAADASAQTIRYKCFNYGGQWECIELGNRPIRGQNDPRLFRNDPRLFRDDPNLFTNNPNW